MSIHRDDSKLYSVYVTWYELNSQIDNTIHYNHLYNATQV